MSLRIAIPPLRNIRITDPLFSRYVDIISERLLPYQWDVLNDRVPGAEKSGCIENFRIAAGESTGPRCGVAFCDTDAYKWLETLAYCLETGRAKALEPTADGLIDLLARAQATDGYLNTYYMIEHPDQRWTDLAEGHELYGAGHLIEAAVAYYSATGKEKLLQIACRFADLICCVFGEGRHPGCPGHEEIELALMKLCRTTGVRRYGDMARHFLSVRGQEPNYLLGELSRRGKDLIFPEFADYDAKYAQSHCPPVRQTAAEGHAVRAVYLYSAMADVAGAYDDGEMEAACRRLWDNMTGKRMYITGGIGSSGHLERFTADYDLPNDRMYCESCASVGLMMFGQRMAALTGQADYYDTVERALCNTVLGGISLEGDRYFYVNPLEVWPDNCLPSTSLAHVKPVRQPWFATACCPPNIARTLASLGQYIYAQDETGVYLNQLISSSLTATTGGVTAELALESRLLADGAVSITVDRRGDGPFTLRLRLPGYLRDPALALDGHPLPLRREKGYALIDLPENGAYRITLGGKVVPVWKTANRRVRADAGRVALTFGPYVYCLEQADNGDNLAGVYVAPDAPVTVCPAREGLPESLPSLQFTGQVLDSGVEGLYGQPKFHLSPRLLTAVPYGLWCNREPGEMLVWMKAK